MDMTTDFTYVGTELDLFARATNWKAYLRRQITPYLGQEVLEIGAGLGGTTLHLCSGRARSLALPGTRSRVGPAA